MSQPTAKEKTKEVLARYEAALAKLAAGEWRDGADVIEIASKALAGAED